MKKIFLAAGLCCMSAIPVSAQKDSNHNFEISKNLEIFNDIYKQLDMFYVDSLSADTVIEWGIDAMLRQVDPFTMYYPEEGMDELKEMTTGKYAGIGAVIRFYKKEDRVMVIEPQEDSPAIEAGVKGGDLILSIDGKDMKGKSTQEVSENLRGDAGTTFELTVKRAGVEHPLSFKITRRNIAMPPVPYYGMVSDGIGYIYFERFVDGCSRDVRRAVVDLKEQGAKALVIDMRGNPGGPLSEAVEVTNLFVPRGQKVVYTKGKLASVNSEHYTKKEPLDVDIPVAVLVDGSTASSAEIVSGAWQDWDRAVIVGERTYGKGLVQMIREVPYHGSLKVTTSRYYIPSGRCIQAYDYRHLNPDGSAKTLPDSLTKAFKTAGGREVRDGGGIKPDVVITPDSLPSIVYDIATSDVLLDYVNHYVQTHATIAPAGDFSLTDADYADFVKMVEESDFTYKRRTEEMMKLLERTARFEGCYEGAKPEFEALAAKMKGGVAADLELPKNKEEIKSVLESDIVARYYFRRGVVQQQLKADKDLKTALEILTDTERYESLLKPVKK
ncbi:MAG: S41 family peptidase [Paraprevotella sp.]|jgi:carboxyl-terminal processing protease|uniref:S41 family peptidase n=1 Tax=Paraprevotella TaxID=577309 RepID=UPI00257FE994|nr:S41 family peptidase [Paraprevotella sp.]MBS4806363.1 S41 family peptidase [Paraprevotella sp.]